MTVVQQPSCVVKRLHDRARTGPAPDILDWYSHCVRLSVNKLGGLGACFPRKIRHSEIASESMFGPKKLLDSPHL